MKIILMYVKTNLHKQQTIANYMYVKMNLPKQQTMTSPRQLKENLLTKKALRLIMVKDVKDVLKRIKSIF